MRGVRIHPEAEQELAAAALYYDEQLRGLGEDFLGDFEATVSRIIPDPERWRTIYGSHRKLNFARFPYAVVYEMSGSLLYIKAVMHLHRRPFYWKIRR